MKGSKKQIVTIVAIFLGFLFVVEGVAKFSVFQPFSQTISSITHLSPDTARFLVVVVIVFEVVGGVLLLLRYETRIVTMTLCFLIGFFIWVLHTAIAQNREIICDCFGFLNIDVPNHIELTIYLILFNILALIAILDINQKKTAVPATTRQKFFTIVAAGIVLYLQIGMVLPAYQRANKNTNADIQRALVYATEHSKDFASITNGNRLLFMLNFRDFDCPPCLDDFILLCDSITAKLQHHQWNRVIILINRTDLDSSRLARWALASGILFPVITAPDNLFTQVDRP